jgi:hypothetical protein
MKWNSGRGKLSRLRDGLGEDGGEGFPLLEGLTGSGNSQVLRLLVETIALRHYNHVLILTSPSPCAKNINGALPRAHCEFSYHLTPGLRFGLSSPAALTRGIFQARFRSLPALVYSIGGAVDARDVRGDSSRLGAFSNAGAAWAGVGDLLRVLLTKVFVLLRPGGITGTLVISASGTVGLTLSAVSLSASSRSLSLLSAAVSR